MKLHTLVFCKFCRLALPVSQGGNFLCSRMSKSPEREVETEVANGENSHEDDRKEDVDDMDRDGADVDDDEEKAEIVANDVERSPSPRARSTSPVREATPDSRSRSPVLFLLQYVLLALEVIRACLCHYRSS